MPFTLRKAVREIEVKPGFLVGAGSARRGGPVLAERFLEQAGRGRLTHYCPLPTAIARQGQVAKDSRHERSPCNHKENRHPEKEVRGPPSPAQGGGEDTPDSARAGRWDGGGKFRGCALAEVGVWVLALSGKPAPRGTGHTDPGELLLKP